jgi:hypothetical protein
MKFNIDETLTWINQKLLRRSKGLSAGVLWTCGESIGQKARK